MFDELTERFTAFHDDALSILFGIATFAANGNDAWARIEFRGPPSGPYGSLDG